MRKGGPIAGMLITAMHVTLFLFTACRLNPPGTGMTGDRSRDERHRPQFHFSPDSMWMNDPNGMVYFEGEYHLFFQHNPYEPVWGPMHWGHAVSSDLVHWRQLPIALYPDSLGTIFSGSAVIDWTNSSGLGKPGVPPMVAIFTHHNSQLEDSGSDRFQVQSLAYSLDRGRSWTKYSGNPVLQNPGIRDFRDPKVIWHQGSGRWIMVLAAHDRIMIYSSSNLIDWSGEGEFTATRMAGEGVWECPDLFPLSAGKEEKWILLVSVGSGGPNQGSGTRYFVGSFDGHNFSNESNDPSPQWIDYGKDNYAGVTWSDIHPADGRRIFLGWMSNWQYANRVPTDRWRSAMTVPRELSLEQRGDQYQLISRPVAELRGLRQERLSLKKGERSGTLEVEGTAELPPSQYEIEVEFEIPSGVDPGDGYEFGLILSNDQEQHLLAGYSPVRKEVYVDRSGSGKGEFSEQFPGLHTAPYRMNPNGIIKLHALVDRSSIELFVDDGRVVLSEIFFPDQDFNKVAIFTRDGKVGVNEGTLYSLKRSR